MSYRFPTGLIVLLIAAVGPSAQALAAGEPPQDSLRYAATRSADSTAVVECVQRAAARYAYVPATDSNAANSHASGLRFRNTGGGRDSLTQLHTKIIVKADSVHVQPRLVRNVVESVAMVSVGVLQVATTCSRARTAEQSGTTR